MVVFRAITIAFGPVIPTTVQLMAYHLSLSTVDGLSYVPTEEEICRNKISAAATGRKTWKTLKDKEGEAVWPPKIEAALIEALKLYVPPPPSFSQVTRARKRRPHFIRFPMRNRFIAEYIFEVTGKKRTAKQVGSRLQQMRDSCKIQQIRDLICRRPELDKSDFDNLSGSSSTSTSPSSLTLSYYPDTHIIPPTPPPPRISKQPKKFRRELMSTAPLNSRQINIHVTVCLDLDASSSRLRRPIALAGFRRDNPLYTSTFLRPLTVPMYSCSGYSLISRFDSSVEVWAPFPVLKQTTFSLFTDLESVSIYSETALLTSRSSTAARTGWSYSTSLCPSFWKTLISDPDVNRYYIIQIMTPACDESSTPLDPIRICYVFQATENEVPPTTDIPTYHSAIPTNFNEPSSSANLQQAQVWMPRAPIISVHQEACSASSYSSLAGWCGEEHEHWKPANNTTSYRRISGPTASTTAPSSSFAEPYAQIATDFHYQYA